MSIYETVVYVVLMATMPGEQPMQVGSMYSGMNKLVECEMDKASYSTSNVPYVLECKRKEIVTEYECGRPFVGTVYGREKAPAALTGTFKGCEEVKERKPNGEIVYGIHWKHIERID